MLRALNVAATNALVLGGLVLMIEAAGRIGGVNFDRLSRHGQVDPRADYPLCFREPDEPFGEVYFKRAGPLEWTGRPLSKILELRHGTDPAYREEQPFTLRYDAQGFRNAPDLKDWDVVVAGDSFTETGYLPQEKIFTSVAAARSGLRIKNLGLCNTGPFTHVEYLRRFGAAPSAKIAMLAFFEGNDITDAEDETADLARLKATGVRPYRQIGPQTSFLKAVYQMVKPWVHFSQEREYQNAVFTAGGRETGITLQPPPMPPDPATMTAERQQVVARFLDEWSATVQKLGMKPWLLYLPINNRTYHGLWRAGGQLPAELRDWTPNALPEVMQSLCEKRDIHFLNACPALRAAAEGGALVYNPIFDTHLNEEGSRVVGELVAKELQSAAAAPADRS